MKRLIRLGILHISLFFCMACCPHSWTTDWNTSLLILLMASPMKVFDCILWTESISVWSRYIRMRAMFPRQLLSSLFFQRGQFHLHFGFKFLKNKTDVFCFLNNLPQNQMQHLLQWEPSGHENSEIFVFPVERSKRYDFSRNQSDKFHRNKTRLEVRVLMSG